MKTGVVPLGEGRRGFMLAITLTEVALLLFFILLLLVTDQKIGSDSLRAENRRLSEELERSAAQAETMDQAKSLLREVYPEAFPSLDAKDNFDEDGFFDAEGGAGLGAAPPDENTEFLHLVRQLQGDARRGAELGQRVSQLEERQEELEEQLEESAADQESESRRAKQLQQQLAFVTDREGPVGFGPPPCWLDPDSGEIDYIFNVTIHENGISVTPAWPAHRRDEALSIPGVREFPRGPMSLAEFSRHAAPIREWCDGQDPECRLYVRIYDRAVSKQAFKRHLLGIENYFYKWLSPE